MNILLVGALTSKPYSFKSRAWELESFKTIDLFDSLCSNIKLDIRGCDIMRITPVNNKYVNDYWISDKTRYAYEGLKYWRYINPMKKKMGFFEKRLFIQCGWANIWKELSFVFSVRKLRMYNNFIIKTGYFTDLEHIMSLKKISFDINKWVSVLINHDEYFNIDFKNNYLLSNNTLNFSKESKKIFIFYNINLKTYNPVLNIKINKLAKKKI